MFRSQTLASTDNYIDALGKGCPLVGLNLEFHTTYFGSERLLYPFPSPSGLSKRGAKLGNMSQRAGKDYIGTPLPVLLSPQQVKSFLAKNERGDYWPWEAIRYSQHLALQANRARRRARQEAQEMEAQLVNNTPGCPRDRKLALRPEIVAADDCRRTVAERQSSKQSSQPCQEKPAAAPTSKPSRQPAAAPAQERELSRSKPPIRHKPLPSDELASSAPPAAQQPQADTPSASPLPPGGGLRRRLLRVIASVCSNPSPNGRGAEPMSLFY